MGEELDDGRAWEHLRDPVHPVARAAQFVDEVTELGTDLGGVGRSRAEHELGTGIEGARSAQQMRDALLPGDAADEEHVRPAGVDTEAAQHVRSVVGPVETGVDAVVDDVHPGRVERRVAAQDVRAHAVGHRDHGVGGLDRGPFGPARERVTAAELLGLPGPQGLQRVGGDHVRDAVEQFGEMAGEIGVPGVGVDEIAVRQRRGHRQVDGEGAQGVVGAVEPGEGGVPHDPVHRARLAPAVHVEFRQRPQLPGEELHMDPGPAVDVRRILACEQSHPHTSMVTQTGPRRKTAAGGGGIRGGGRGVAGGCCGRCRQGSRSWPPGAVAVPARAGPAHTGVSAHQGRRTVRPLRSRGGGRLRCLPGAVGGVRYGRCRRGARSKTQSPHRPPPGQR